MCRLAGVLGWLKWNKGGEETGEMYINSTLRVRTWSGRAPEVASVLLVLVQAQ